MNDTIKKYTEYVTVRVVKTESGYGLFIISGEGRGRVYPDLSCSPAFLCELADKINQGEVSPLHIDDIIEDVLG